MDGAGSGGSSNTTTLAPLNNQHDVSKKPPAVKKHSGKVVRPHSACLTNQHHPLCMEVASSSHHRAVTDD